MSRSAAAGLLAALLAAGCLGAPAGDVERPWTLGGSFSPDRTQADLDAWCAIARAYGNECILMESFPEQFMLRFATQPECEEARARLAELPRVLPGECREADHAQAPDAPVASPTGEAATEYDVGTFALTWWDGDPGEQPRAMEWTVAAASSREGLVTIETTTEGIEGGDFRLALRMRPGPGDADLAHAPGAASPGTFDFDYSEAVFWAGRPVERVDAVDPRSFVSIDARDDARGTLAGRFLLDFTGGCEEGTPNCPSPGAAQRTVLEGRFGR